MQNSLLTEDTYKRADNIYRSIADGFNPTLREYVACGKIHEKNIVEEGRSFKTCHEAAMKIGIAGSASPGCKDVGATIMSMAETLQEVNMIHDEWLQKFRSDILYPMERRLEQDSKYIIGLRKKSQDEFKSRNTETDKAFMNLAKLRKKLGAKTISKKSEEKAHKATERLISAKAASEMVAHEMLNRAFSEERRRFCFFVDKQCELIQAWVNYHKTSFDILQANLDDWKTVGASYRNLLPGAVALIEGSLPRRTNISLNELDMEMGKDNTGARVSPTGASSKSSLRRNESARANASPREVDLYNPYHQQLANSTHIPIHESPQSSGNEEQESHHQQLAVTETSNDTLSQRSSGSSAYMKSLFRYSAGSAYSEVSNVSNEVADTPSTGNVRTSLNDSGISVGDVWASEHEDCDTIRRNKAKSPMKESTSDIDTISTTSSRPSLEDDPVAEVQQAIPAYGIFYEAIHDFSPQQGTTKLDMERGDILDVLDDEERGGWLYGTNRRTQERGWFPITYLNYGKRQTHDSGPPELPAQGSTPTKHQIPKSSSPQSASPPVRRIDTDVTQQQQHTAVIGNPQETQNFETQESPARQQNAGKKLITGRNVFQFAKDMQNPFEEIHLRKTSANSLH